MQIAIYQNLTIISCPFPPRPASITTLSSILNDNFCFKNINRYDIIKL